MACGSTIGPISSAKLGIPTLDVGQPLLSMHSIREMVDTSSVHQSVVIFTVREAVCRDMGGGRFSNLGPAHRNLSSEGSFGELKISFRIAVWRFASCGVARRVLLFADFV